MNPNSKSHAPHLPPAQLWLGKHEELLIKATEYLQKIFCPNTSCGICATCHNLRLQQHHATTWLYPEKQYTLDQLAIINQTVAFALEHNQHHFFIIQKADALTQACSNSLLKLIEEPPHGYHFILLTERPDEILPTIKSRCITHSYYSDKEYIRHKNLYAIFTTALSTAPAAFLKELEQAKITERDSVELLDQILAFWLNKSKTAIMNNDEQGYARAQIIIATIKEALLMPPMPGSSNLLWKNLSIQLQSRN